jgi:hypothetical protein
MRLAASSFSRILRSLCVGSPLMHVRVAWGIWAQMELAKTVFDMVYLVRVHRGGVLYVQMIKARPVMRTQPPIPNTLGELEMMCVMLANTQIAMAALTAGSVASSNLSSMGVKDYWKGVPLRELDQVC